MITNNDRILSKTRHRHIILIHEKIGRVKFPLDTVGAIEWHKSHRMHFCFFFYLQIKLEYPVYSISFSHTSSVKRNGRKADGSQILK